MNLLRFKTWCGWCVRAALGVALLLAYVSTPVLAEDATTRVLYNFEKGKDGWWTFKKGAKIEVGHDTPGADSSQGALKITFKFGKGGSYLGVGVEPKWALNGKDSVAEYKGGQLQLWMKSNCRNGVTVELRSKGTFRFRIPAMEDKWGLYSIPLSEFKSKDTPFDPATLPLKQIVLIPRGGKGADRTMWVDNVTLTSAPLDVNSAAPVFKLAGKVVSDGKPVEGVDMVMTKFRSSSVLAQTKTKADGTYALDFSMSARKFRVKPLDACPEVAVYKAELNISKDGYGGDFKYVELKPGANTENFDLPKAKQVVMPRVKGNRIVGPDGKEIWLQGLCIDSLEWSAVGDNMLQSTMKAITDWNVNVLRIPVKEEFWFGETKYQKDGGKYYRELVDNIIKLASSRGVYTIIDLHRFRAPMAKHKKFWLDVAEKYKNRPDVIFEIFNEPHGISWEIWRNGGDLEGKKNKHDDKGVVENKEKASGKVSVGMQALVDAIRSTGAKNIIIAGGVDWSYNLQGILKGFALDDKTGNGIVYSTHVYPWKKGWQKNFLDIAEKYPIFIGEVGNIRAWEDFSFISKGERLEDLSKKEWAPDMIGTIQKHRLNWTAFSFHPKCGPMVIKDWDYTPTEYWGTYVRKALVDGKVYEVKRIR